MRKSWGHLCSFRSRNQCPYQPFALRLGFIGSPFLHALWRVLQCLLSYQILITFTLWVEILVLSWFYGMIYNANEEIKPWSSTLPTPHFWKCGRSHPRLRGAGWWCGDRSAPQSQVLWWKDTKENSCGFIPARYGQTDEFLEVTWPLILGTVSAKNRILMTACTSSYFSDEDLAPQLLLFKLSTPHLRLFPASSWCLLEVITWAIFGLDSVYHHEDMKNLQVTDLNVARVAFVHHHLGCRSGAMSTQALCRDSLAQRRLHDCHYMMSKSFAKTSMMTAALFQVVFIMRTDNCLSKPNAKGVWQLLCHFPIYRIVANPVQKQCFE